MVYIILFIAAAALFYIIFKNERGVLYGDLTCRVSDEEFLKELDAAVSRNILPNRSGAGVSISFKGVIKKAYRMIARKVKRGDLLFDCEKWLYENHRLILRHLNKTSYDCFSGLPHTDGIPRIVKLAELVINYSGGELLRDRVETAVKTQNLSAPLYYNETAYFADALSYVLLKKIAYVSRRVIHNNRMHFAALRGKNLIKRLMTSDVYVYYVLKKRPELSLKLSRYLRKEKDYDGLDYAFSALIVENNILAARAAGSLHTLDECTAGLFGFFKPHKIMLGDDTYATSDLRTRHIYLKQIAKLSDEINLRETTFAERLLALAERIKKNPGVILFKYPDVIKRYAQSGVVIPSEEGKRERAYRTVFFWAFAAVIAVCAGAVAYLAYGAWYFSGEAFAASGAVLSPYVRRLGAAGGLFSQGTGAFTLARGIIAGCASVASVLALFPAALETVIKIMGAFLKKRPVFCKSLLSVPDEARTLVLVSEYVSSKEQLLDAVRRVKIMQAVNDDGNVTFALLIDIPPQDEEQSAFYREIYAAIGELLTKNGALNKRIIGLLRKPCVCSDAAGYGRKSSSRAKKRRENACRLAETSATSVKFSARERKRGAIEDINKAAVTGDFSAFDCTVIPDRPEFVVLLDDDSVLEPGGVLAAVAEMTHPVNGFDLMSFRNLTDLRSIRTAYSYRFLKLAGRDAYRENTDFYFALTGGGVFTGKGIYRLDTFYGKLGGVLPEGCVLSHDIIEGALLNTGASGVAVYETAPDGFSCDEERGARWTRGDIQLLPLLSFNRADGASRVKLPHIYAFIIVNNALKPLRALAIFLMLTLAAVFADVPLAVSGGALLLYPFAVRVAAVILNGGTRRKIYVLKEVCHELLNLTEETALLPLRAVNGAALFFGTLLKMARGKNLLNWRTFYMSRNCGGATVRMLAPSAVLLSALAVAAYLLAVNGVYAGVPYLSVYIFSAALIAELTAACILYAAGNGMRKPRGRASVKAHEERVRKLKEYARRTYEYFENEQNNGIIADNFQEAFDVGRRPLTSPTNIGYSLLAEISAERLGLIDAARAESGIVKILDAVDTLEKWNGHLYNWYDTDTREKLPPHFVSSVDSGNFAAALIVAKGYVEDTNKELAARIEKMLAAIDFKALYDFKRGLFYIGYTPGKGYGGHYDLLAGEARLLSITGISRGIPVEHWNGLSREHTPLYGNTLYSWNGTAFEYFMPELFLAAPSKSLIGASVRHAARYAIRRKCKGLYGISESGRYEFDAQTVFQYQAFGLNEIALKSDVNSCVISPYSTFISLEHNPSAAMRNLKKLKARGVYGRYGFYEAVDYTAGGGTVTSFMAHHQGMILCAAANYVDGGLIRRLMLKDAAIAGTEILLAEKMTEAKGERKPKAPFVYLPPPAETAPEEISGRLLFPRFNLLAGNRYLTITDDYGQGFSVSGGRDINRFRRDMLKPYGAFLYLRDTDGSRFKEGRKRDFDGELFSPSFAPLYNDDEFAVSFTQNKSRYENKTRGVSEEVYTPDFMCGEIRRFRIENDGATPRKLRLAFAMPISLSDRGSDLAHPNFGDMFVTSRYDGGGLIVFEKRMQNSEDRVLLAVKIDGLQEISPVTDRDMFYGDGDGKRPAVMFGEITAGVYGDCLYPIAGFAADAEVPKEGALTFDVSIIFAADADELARNLKRLKYQRAEDYLTEKPFLIKGKDMLSAPVRKYLCNLLPKLLYIPYPSDKLSAMGDDDKKLFAELTDGFKRKIIYHKYTRGSKLVSELSVMLKTLYDLEIPVTLIIGYEDSDGYFKPVKSEIGALLKYGIIGDHVRLTEENLERFAYAVADEELNGLVIAEYAVGDGRLREGKSVPHKPSLAMPCGEGGFLSDGAYAAVPEGARTRLPYSNVIAGRVGGTVITANGGGFTYFNNSQTGRLTAHGFDPVLDEPSEELFWIGGGEYVRLNGGNAVHRPGRTDFYFDFDRVKGVLSEYIIRDGAAKVMELRFSKPPADGVILLNLKTELGVADGGDYVIYAVSDGVMTATNLRTGVRLYLRALGGAKTEYVLNGNEFMSRAGGGLSKCGGSFYMPSAAACVSGAKDAVYFLLGGDLAAVSADEEEIKREGMRSEAYFTSLNPFKIKTADKCLDTLFNRWLLCQTVSSRINARAGYYQTGGAIGFRDQLQDMLALLYKDTARVRAHILDCARHQYAEGDVMHWWHPEKLGVRTRISDDRLFLAYVTAEYISASGDRGILKEKIPYLKSEPLNRIESARYEEPEYAGEGTLYEHIIRAADRAATGESGLLLIGGGDWNDALDAVGDEKRGESVWLTMFYIAALKKLLPYADRADLAELTDRAEILAAAVDRAFADGRYKRLKTKEGIWLGEKGADVELDLLTQAFASLSGACPKDKTAAALATADSLVDRENGIVKLTDKPFNNGFYGYISRYHEGIRENGGQYTHAAVWYAAALFEEGKTSEGYGILRILNPVDKCRDKRLAAAYKGEPYVIAADVYANPKFLGRMGWNWYTGSAAWYYTTVLKMLGISIKENRLLLSPKLPPELPEAEVEYRRKNAVYFIKLKRTGTPAFFFDGLKIEGVDSVKLSDDGVYRLEAHC
ncbi:MAG: DUF3131 domain-containing protein [Clostridiaceae bacterium]|jgi:cyclic beta-1,2-glucan synthetase|nr:DUF3131 domain-containing protein [Clostridiaceae bacterium]